MPETVLSTMDESVQSQESAPSSKQSNAEPETHQVAPPDEHGSESSLKGFTRLIYLILKDDQMTARLCKVIRQTSMGCAFVMIPLIALAYIVAVHAPAEWKYILGGASTLIVGIGSALGGRVWNRHSKGQRSKKS